jgi:hypothetical protein
MGRAIGLPALRATVGRHKRAKIDSYLSSSNGLGDVARTQRSGGQPEVEPTRSMLASARSLTSRSL